MTYTKPGVYITQKLEEVNAAVPEVTDFIPGIIGVPISVYEGSLEQAASLETTGSTVDLEVSLPNFKGSFLPIANSIKVYVSRYGVAPQVNHLTQKWFRDKGLPEPTTDIAYYEVKASAIDTTDITNGKIKVSITGETDLTAINGADYFNFSTGKYSVYVEYAAIVQSSFSTTETFTLTANQREINLQHYPVTAVASVMHNETTLTADDPTDGYTINEVSGAITLGSSLTISDDDTLVVVYSYENPLFTSPQRISSIDELEAMVGDIHPYNALGFAAYLALTKAGSGPIYIMGVPPAANDLNNAFVPDSTEFSNALSKFGDIEVYTIVGIGDIGDIGAAVQQHVSAYSQPSESKFRIAMLGYKDFASASANLGTDRQAALNDLLATVYNYEDRRIRILLNPEIYVAYNGIDYPVPGVYYSAIYAGLKKTLSEAPSTPLTRYAENMVTGVRWPNGLPNYFTESELDNLAAAGYWILDQVGSTVRVRHQMTTAETYVETREDSIVTGIDWLSVTIKDVLDKHVGGANITRAYLESIFMAINAVIEKAKTINACGPNTKLVSLVQNANSPDTIDVVLDYDPLYPSNVIRITIKSPVRNA